MQKNIIAIRREDLDKKGEKRVAITPNLAAKLRQLGHRVLVQPGRHPETDKEKRIFTDEAYALANADIVEDISAADVIFGLKEVDASALLADKVYLMFSHTHKGQVKNRGLLKALVEKKCTLFDYELIVDGDRKRLITAFTYFAGYAGMIDTLWAYGQRLKVQGVSNLFEAIPQSIEKEDLRAIKRILEKTGEKIKAEGTNPELPPVITCFLGDGKTSTGAQEIYDILPSKEISLAELPDIFEQGDRKRVYKVVLNIDEMFRLSESHYGKYFNFDSWTPEKKIDLYFKEPDHFESNLDQVLPYISILMNCTLWAPQYPRILPKKLMREAYEQKTPLVAIGDITCDPEGSIEFSKETWVDKPVYMYDPESEKQKDGFEGKGVAVMAITNLPCEFSADASKQFSADLEPLLEGFLKVGFDKDFQSAKLPDPLRKACILWKGKFTLDYAYMNVFVMSPAT